MAEKPAAQPRKITAGLVLAWIFGVIFTIAGFAGSVTGDFGFSIPLLLAGLILLPIVRQLIRERMHFELSTGLLVIIVGVLLVISIVNTPSSTSAAAPAAPSRNDVSAAPASVRCPTGETAKSAAECPRVLGLGDRVAVDELTWTFTGTSRRSALGDAFLNKQADGVFLIVSAEVENTGNRAQYVSADMVKLVDDRGREFAPDTGAAFYLNEPALSFDQINPGIVKKGALVYDVPEDIRVARVRISDGLLSSDTYYVNLLG